MMKKDTTPQNTTATDIYKMLGVVDLRTEFNEIDDQCFCALMNLKTEKINLKNAKTVKGEWINFPHTTRPYEGWEKKRILRRAEGKWREAWMLFRVLWVARRRMQNVIFNNA
jgi:hypothetical protein